MPGEFDFIKQIWQIQQKAATQTAADLVFGIGDDAAIWREQTGRESLVTVDLLVEDVDFKLEYAPPRSLGHKALAVSLSDIAAMGGAPKFSLLTLAIPPNLKSQISNPEFENFWEEFFAGYFALAARHGVQLIGGDISSTPDRLTIDSIAIGHCQTGKAVRRNGAKVGDGIYLTGSVGASAAGLTLLLEGERVDEGLFHRRDAETTEQARREEKTSALSPLSLRLCGEDGPTKELFERALRQSALRAHLRPEPRVEFGRKIGESGLVHSMLVQAMIDVSDGLAQDLRHICEASGVGAVLEFDAVPVAAEVKLVTTNSYDAFELAVSGGEDFELLFTAHRKDEAALFGLAASCQLKLTRIGEVLPADPAAKIWLRRNSEVKPLSIRGYDHFAAGS
ncbi:MAG: thiamine-phosphate kinase [Acidobacteriota bacterium]|nr:thiamine-phosphate kinase [Acidobacteriota bacterium]